MEPDRRHRKSLPHNVLQVHDRKTVVFVTVCTKDRVHWLATDLIHQELISAWQQSDRWIVGKYMIMPDHIHMFVSPIDPEITLNNWVRYWKRVFTLSHNCREHQWQDGYWDRTLRSKESYESKWEYVRYNPARHGYVEHPDEWKYQGELNVLSW